MNEAERRSTTVNRRQLIAGAGAAFIASSPLKVLSACVNIPGGLLGCSYGTRKHFQVVVQDCPERCWAASTAGIFRYHGHPIDQDDIAMDIFKTLACKAAGNPAVLTAVLSKVWTDTNGKDFKSTVAGLYDPLDGVNDLDNDDIVSAMLAGNPMLYANKTHAMVIVGIEYRKNIAGKLIDIVDVRVGDPYPGKGIRSLSTTEMIPINRGGEMTYLASVDVDDV
jgi:hypothetical protein